MGIGSGSGSGSMRHQVRSWRLGNTSAGRSSPRRSPDGEFTKTSTIRWRPLPLILTSLIALGSRQTHMLPTRAPYSTLFSLQLNLRRRQTHLLLSLCFPCWPAIESTKALKLLRFVATAPTNYTARDSRGYPAATHRWSLSCNCTHQSKLI